MAGYSRFREHSLIVHSLRTFMGNIICLLYWLSFAVIRISLANATTETAAIPDQHATKGKWVQNMSNIVRSGDETTGQISSLVSKSACCGQGYCSCTLNFCKLQQSEDCEDCIDAGFTLILPKAAFVVQCVVDDEGNGSAIPVDMRQGQFRFKIYEQVWQGPIYKVTCKVSHI